LFIWFFSNSLNSLDSTSSTNVVPLSFQKALVIFCYKNNRFKEIWLCCKKIPYDIILS